MAILFLQEADQQFNRRGICRLGGERRAPACLGALRFVLIVIRNGFPELEHRPTPAARDRGIDDLDDLLVTPQVEVRDEPRFEDLLIVGLESRQTGADRQGERGLGVSNQMARVVELVVRRPNAVFHAGDHNLASLICAAPARLAGTRAPLDRTMVNREPSRGSTAVTNPRFTTWARCTRSMRGCWSSATRSCSRA